MSRVTTGFGFRSESQNNDKGAVCGDIADYTDCYLFISHDSIQDYLTGEWMGMLEPDMTYWNIVFTIPFPFLASFRKISDSEIQNKMISKEIDEMERKKMAFVSKKTVEGTTGKDPVQQGQRRLNLLQRMYHFYNAPVVKFFIYILMYFAFLVSFSYALLIKQPKTRASGTMDNAEFVVYIWTVSIIPVEIRQIYHSCPSTTMGKIRNYLSNQYNKFDVYSMMFIFISFCCRVLPRLGLPENADNLPPARLEEAVFRVFFAFGFAGMCLRLLQAMQINSRLGPKVLMVASMIMDLVFFLGLLGMALICYGVPTKSLITPTKSNVTTDMIYDLFWRPYINMFGELDLDSLTEDINEGYCLLANQYNHTVNCTDAKTAYDCSADKYCFYNRLLIYLMMSAYLMVVAVMMLNLLVAVFTFTYDQINANSAILWRWQRYELVTEFKMRSSLPIPFNTIVLCVFFLRFLYRKSCSRGEFVRKRDAYKRRHDHKQDRISLLESECRRNLLNKLNEVTEMKQIQHQVHVCATSVDSLTSAVQDFNQNLQSIVDQTVNARCTPDLNHQAHQSSAPQGTTNLNNWGHQSSATQSLMSIGTAAALSVGQGDRTYPGSAVVRDYVPPIYQSWSVVFLTYNPPSYSQDPGPDSSSAEYNTGDRRSSLGIYGVRDHLPLNPRGRTGLAGKGSLPHWGPNHIAVPIVTRGQGTELEVLLFEDGGIVALLEITTPFNPLPTIIHELTTIFTTYSSEMVTDKLSSPTESREASNSTAEVTEQSSDANPTLEDKESKYLFFKRGLLIEREYLDSTFNTDNAWLEFTCYNFHDHDSELHDFSIRNTAYRWAMITETCFNKPKHSSLINKISLMRRH
ncbi:transient receptor potential cation channel subfamily M member 2-like [Bolinopsis microptera]|uniref:transient receptor potential cation channel subfamily M member 2-like n=1 Tax=Bolinopsis microptera TaxID=2820187 RepID=UPI003079A814